MILINKDFPHCDIFILFFYGIYNSCAKGLCQAFLLCYGLVYLKCLQLIQPIQPTASGTSRWCGRRLWMLQPLYSEFNLNPTLF